MQNYSCTFYTDELYHYGILGMKWGVRRYQNDDGSLTSLGKIHYGIENMSNTLNKSWKIANDPLWMEMQLERIGSKSKSAANSVMNGMKALNDPFFSEYFHMKTRQLNNNSDISDLSNAKQMRELTETIFEYDSPLINGKDFVLSTFSDPNSLINNVSFEDLAEKSIKIHDKTYGYNDDPTNDLRDRTVEVIAPSRFTVPGVSNGNLYGLSPEGGNKSWTIEMEPEWYAKGEVDKSMTKKIVNENNSEKISDLRKRYARLMAQGNRNLQRQYDKLSKIYTNALDYYKDPYAY